MKYIIDIDEPEDCGCCPMNYDYIGCQVYKGDKKIDPLKEWVEANLPDGVRPDRCPLNGCEVTWLDGKPVDSTCDEESLHESVSDAITSIDETIEQLSVMSEYLKAYDVLCGKLREASDE